ncbi:chaperone protein dnaJ 11, chloroplastic-like, partial [Lycium barbarum]|uniref:chaperone protein dnaJ 11, chloroplastic-like n=1 Tax=Lycium barbarum TaxID=112863 RepID=UPI00293EF8E2
LITLEQITRIPMISTSTHSFLQIQPPPVNIFSPGDNSVLSPSSVRFRQSGSFTTAAATCASVETESATRYSTLPTAASFYEILGIPVGATVEEIKGAYRRLARVCHPDVAEKDTSADDFMKIHAAYSTLSDPDKRADYDRRLPRRRGRSGNIYSGGCYPLSPSVMSGYTTRNWETDQCW